jgi:hypothetical protein
MHSPFAQYTFNILEVDEVALPMSSSASINQHLNTKNIDHQNAEPHCKDYFQPSIVAGESESKHSNVAKEHIVYVERRADIGMLDTSMERPRILIDCTMVAPNAAYIKDYANSGQAAELTVKRKVEYYSKHFKLPITFLVIFSLWLYLRKMRMQTYFFVNMSITNPTKEGFMTTIEIKFSDTCFLQIWNFSC